MHLLLGNTNYFILPGSDCPLKRRCHTCGGAMLPPVYPSTNPNMLQVSELPAIFLCKSTRIASDFTSLSQFAFF